MPHDPGETLKRVNSVLALFFVPDEDMETKAGVREEFVRALQAYPDWAVQRAFDSWCRTRVRRPTPGEIVILASNEVKPLADEMARRKRAFEAAEAERAKATADRCPGDVSARIMAEAGFTPKRMEALRKAPMAGSLAEADAVITRPAAPHWTESASDAALDQLRAARDANPIIAEVRLAEARARKALDGDAA